MLAGGKFIDGFRQGLITAGLNHTAHLVEESIMKGEFISRMKGELGELNHAMDDVPDATAATVIRLIRNLPLLKKLFSYESWVIKDGNPDLIADAYTMGVLSENESKSYLRYNTGNFVQPGKTGTLLLSTAFLNYKVLVETLAQVYFYTHQNISKLPNISMKSRYDNMINSSGWKNWLNLSNSRYINYYDPFNLSSINNRKLTDWFAVFRI